MSTGRNRMRELASGIHGMMMEAENKRRLENGENITEQRSEIGRAHV